MDILNTLDAGTSLAINTPDQATLPTLDANLPDVGLPTFDLNPHPSLADWGQQLPDFNPQPMDWNTQAAFDALQTDWSQPQVDWGSQPQTDWSDSSLQSHDYQAMPRSSSDAEFYTKQAETATENVAYHQKLANAYKADADYYLNHGEPDKAADNLGYAAAEQAKVTSYQQDMQTALDKAKTATNS